MANNARPFDRLNLPAMDHYLESLLSASSDTPLLRPGHVLEISGQEKSGKTNFLLHLILTTVLPVEIVLNNTSIPLGGKGASVIFVDMDSRSFMLNVLIRWIRAHLKRCLSHASLLHGTAIELSLADETALIQTCLENCIILRPSSPKDLLNLLTQLLPTMSGIDAFPHRPMLLAFDPITAFLDFPQTLDMHKNLEHTIKSLIQCYGLITVGVCFHYTISKPIKSTFVGAYSLDEPPIPESNIDTGKYRREKDAAWWYAVFSSAPLAIRFDMECVGVFHEFECILTKMLIKMSGYQDGRLFMPHGLSFSKIELEISADGVFSPVHDNI